MARTLKGMEMSQSLRPLPIHLELSRLTEAGSLIEFVHVDSVINDWKLRYKIPWSHVILSDTVLKKRTSESELSEVPGILISGSVAIFKEIAIPCMRDLALSISRSLDIKTVHILYGEGWEEVQADRNKLESDIPVNILVTLGEASPGSLSMIQETGGKAN